jgi:hypothetical protein
MNKTILIRAISNFFRLGLSKNQNVYSILKKWIKYQIHLQHILQNLTFKGLVAELGISKQDDINCRFFITAHYGIYPFLLVYLQSLFPDKKIAVLVAKQKSLGSLKLLAEKYNLNLIFVEVGESFIFFRKCIKLSKEGCIFYSLNDIPLGMSTKTDSTLDFLDGKIKVKGGLLKIAEKLKLTPRFIISGFDQKTGSVPIQSYPVESVEDIFDIFQQHISDKPYLWDKVVDLNKFYESNIEPDTYFPFKLAGEYFILEISKDKIMRINKCLYLKINQLKLKTNSIKDVEYYRDTIYDQANLCVRKAV